MEGLNLSLTNQPTISSPAGSAIQSGLANRTLFQERLGQALLQASRSGTLVAVAMLALKRFKAINESLGHSTGNNMPAHVGQCLTPSLRKGTRWCACLPTSPR